MHDLPPAVLAQALQRPVHQTDCIFLDPWPLPAWRQHTEAVVIDSGHLPALAAPAELAAALDRIRGEVACDP